MFGSFIILSPSLFMSLYAHMMDVQKNRCTRISDPVRLLKKGNGDELKCEETVLETLLTTIHSSSLTLKDERNNIFLSNLDYVGYYEGLSRFF